MVVFPAWFLLHSPIARPLWVAQKLEISRGRPAPVVMVVLDELCGMELMEENRQIDAARYPNFAELARGSTWFRNATTVFPDTWQAVPVLLSGHFPKNCASAAARDVPQNLFFSILDSAGSYEFAVFEPVSKLASHRVELSKNAPRTAPAQLAAVAPTLTRVYLQHLAPSALQWSLPGIPPLWFGFGQRRIIDRDARRGVFRYEWGDDRQRQFEHFLECLDGSPQPTLYFFHVLLPHVPWCYLPTGRRYLAESDQFELLDFDTHSGIYNLWGTDELYVAQSQQRHLLQLQYTDVLLGQMLARLRETGLYDKCLLVVAADHGISFKINDLRRGVSAGNLADIMSVPLFIKIPGQQAGAVSDQRVETIDVLPTIADVLKIDLPLPVDGCSVFDDRFPERDQRTIYESIKKRMSTPANVLEGSTMAAELRSRLGSADDPQGLFRIGPHPKLLGLSPQDLPSDEGPAVEIKLNRSDTRYTTDRDDLVPCYYEGIVCSPFSDDKPVHIAVAVNGVIRAVTRTYRLDGVRNRWAAMVPENSLHQGENEIKFYSVTGDASGLHLTECIVKNSALK